MFPYVYVCILSHPTDDNEVMEMLMSHFDRLEKIPEYQNAYVFVYIESNMSYISADRFQRGLKNRGHGSLTLEFVDRDPQGKGRAGVRTEDNVKEAMVLDLKRDLSNGAIQLARSFVSADENNILNKLQRQLKQFRKVPRGTHDPANGKISFRFTGKMSGQPDDIAFCLMMTNYYGRITQLSEQYRHMAAANGWLA